MKASLIVVLAAVTLAACGADHGLTSPSSAKPSTTTASPVSGAITPVLTLAQACVVRLVKVNGAGPSLDITLSAPSLTGVKVDLWQHDEWQEVREGYEAYRDSETGRAALPGVALFYRVRVWFGDATTPAKYRIRVDRCPDVFKAIAGPNVCGGCEDEPPTAPPIPPVVPIPPTDPTPLAAVCSLDALHVEWLTLPDGDHEMVNVTVRAGYVGTVSGLYLDSFASTTGEQQHHNDAFTAPGSDAIHLAHGQAWRVTLTCADGRVLAETAGQ